MEIETDKEPTQAVTPDELRELAMRAEAAGQRPLASILYAASSMERIGCTERMARHLEPFIRLMLGEIKRELARLEDRGMRHALIVMALLSSLSSQAAGQTGGSATVNLGRNAGGTVVPDGLQGSGGVTLFAGMGVDPGHGWTPAWLDLWDQVGVTGLNNGQLVAWTVDQPAIGGVWHGRYTGTVRISWMFGFFITTYIDYTVVVTFESD